MITVKDFLEKITNPDRIKIVKGEEVLFAGYKGALVHEGARGPFAGHSGSGNGIFQNRSGDPGERLEGARTYGPDRTGTGAGL